MCVYSREILEGLARAAPGDRWLWCYRPHRFLASLKQPLPRNCARRPLWDALGAGGDLFHGLNQRLPARNRRRAVTTFHDLFVMTAEYSSKEFRRRLEGQARDAAARSDHVICVSAFTAGQVTALLGVEAARISVIPHGVRQLPAAGGMERERIILSVGAVQHRKNTARLIRAFERVPAGWKLVLTGSLGFGGEEIAAQVESSVRRADIEMTGWVDDSRLSNLYRRASVFAFPSLEEGFGIPVLEAMAHGVPVVTSNTSSMPEVAGDAAWLIDPRSEEELGHALATLAESAEAREQLAARGRARAAAFPWEAAVERTQAVYRKLL